jgi:hypothetical protein
MNYKSFKKCYILSIFEARESNLAFNDITTNGYTFWLCENLNKISPVMRSQLRVAHISTRSLASSIINRDLLLNNRSSLNREIDDLSYNYYLIDWRSKNK